MKATHTLTQVVERVREFSDGREDMIVSPRQLRMHGGDLTVCTDIGSGRRFQLSTWAQSQLCTKLGIPATYFRKCPTVLQDEQFAYWMNKLIDDHPVRHPKFLLRGRGPNLHGFLSDRYACLDNSDIVAAVEPLIDRGMVVTWFEVSDLSLHLRLIDPTKARDVRHGDPVFAGLHIANSEVGLRALTLDSVVYRQVCTNGLIRMERNRSVFRRKHLGSRPRELVAQLSESAHEALILATGTMDKFAEAATRPVSDPVEQLQKLAQPYDISDKVQESIIRQLSSEQLPDTAFGLVNAITSYARTQDPEARFRLESMAGAYLN